MTLIEGIGVTFFLFGITFSALGVLGIVRLPDVYARLHASGKTATLGLMFICLGAAILMPSHAIKLAALLFFMLFSAPVVSHAIAAAVLRGTRQGRTENQAEEGTDAPQSASL